MARPLPTRSLLPAAVGFRAHSGWAVMIVAAGTPVSPEIIVRRRIELAAGKTPRQPYHAAESLDFKQAEKLVRDCTTEAAALAQTALRVGLQESEARGYEIVAGGVLSASGRPLPDLRAILASHALIHTAEGEMFRSALAQACEHCDLPAIRVKERDLYSTASAQLALSPEQIETRLKEVGRALGPPWRQDEKLATVIAWMALHTAKGKRKAAKGEL